MNNQGRLAVATWLTAATLLACSGTALAQQAPVPEKQGGPLVLFNAQYGTPLRLAGGIGVLLPVGKPVRNTDGGTEGTRAGLEVEAGAGAGGMRLAVGPAAYMYEGAIMGVGVDARVTLARASDSPRGATVHSTYLGAEAGLVISLMKVSAGVAHRVAGLSGQKAMIFTWSVGVQVPIGW